MLLGLLPLGLPGPASTVRRSVVVSSPTQVSALIPTILRRLSIPSDTLIELVPCNPTTLELAEPLALDVDILSVSFPASPCVVVRPLNSKQTLQDTKPNETTTTPTSSPALPSQQAQRPTPMEITIGQETAQQPVGTPKSLGLADPQVSAAIEEAVTSLLIPPPSPSPPVLPLALEADSSPEGTQQSLVPIPTIGRIGHRGTDEAEERWEEIQRSLHHGSMTEAICRDQAPDLETPEGSKRLGLIRPREHEEVFSAMASQPPKSVHTQLPPNVPSPKPLRPFRKQIFLQVLLVLDIATNRLIVEHPGDTKETREIRETSEMKVATRGGGATAGKVEVVRRKGIPAIVVREGVTSVKQLYTVNPTIPGAVPKTPNALDALSADDILTLITPSNTYPTALRLLSPSPTNPQAVRLMFSVVSIGVAGAGVGEEGDGKGRAKGRKPASVSIKEAFAGLAALVEEMSEAWTKEKDEKKEKSSVGGVGNTLRKLIGIPLAENIIGWNSAKVRTQVGNGKDGNTDSNQLLPRLPQCLMATPPVSLTSPVALTKFQHMPIEDGVYISLCLMQQKDDEKDKDQGRALKQPVVPANPWERLDPDCRDDEDVDKETLVLTSRRVPFALPSVRVACGQWGSEEVCGLGKWMRMGAVSTDCDEVGANGDVLKVLKEVEKMEKMEGVEEPNDPTSLKTWELALALSEAAKVMGKMYNLNVTSPFSQPQRFSSSPSDDVSSASALRWFDFGPVSLRGGRVWLFLLGAYVEDDFLTMPGPDGTLLHSALKDDYEWTQLDMFQSAVTRAYDFAVGAGAGGAADKMEKEKEDLSRRIQILLQQPNEEEGNQQQQSDGKGNVGAFLSLYIRRLQHADLMWPTRVRQWAEAGFPLPHFFLPPSVVAAFSPRRVLQMAEDVCKTLLSDTLYCDCDRRDGWLGDGVEVCADEKLKKLTYWESLFNFKVRGRCGSFRSDLVSNRYVPWLSLAMTGSCGSVEEGAFKVFPEASFAFGRYLDTAQAEEERSDEEESGSEEDDSCPETHSTDEPHTTALGNIRTCADVVESLIQETELITTISQVTEPVCTAIETILSVVEVTGIIADQVCVQAALAERQAAIDKDTTQVRSSLERLEEAAATKVLTVVESSEEATKKDDVALWDKSHLAEALVYSPDKPTVLSGAIRDLCGLFGDVVAACGAVASVATGAVELEKVAERFGEVHRVVALKRPRRECVVLGGVEEQEDGHERTRVGVGMKGTGVFGVREGTRTKSGNKGRDGGDSSSGDEDGAKGKSAGLTLGGEETDGLRKLIRPRPRTLLEAED